MGKKNKTKRGDLFKNSCKFKLGWSLAVKNALGLILNSGIHNKLRRKVYLGTKECGKGDKRIPVFSVRVRRLIMYNGVPHQKDYQNSR